MPDEFGVLSTTNLDSAYISFSKNERGKFGPSDVAFVVSSELDLMIWDAPSVRIDELSLSYSYSRGAGSDVIFHSILNIGEAALDTNITYNGPGASSALNMATTNPSTPATTQMANRAGSWAITSTYDGTISFFNIIKRLSGLDLQEKLSGNDLTVIRKVLDVNISKLTLSLTKQQDAASIFLQARTDWLVFESLAIAASKDTLGWGFSLGLACQDNLLALLPSDFAQNLSDYVKVNDTVVAIFLGELDPVVFPPLATLVPRPQWAGNGIGGGVAVATTVKIDNTTKLKVIGMLLSKADIQVVGVIKNDLFSLSVRVKSFSLLQNKLQIAGDFVVLSDTQTKLFIGIRGTPPECLLFVTIDADSTLGTFSFDLGPEITQDRIAGAIDFGLDISNPALIGLSFKVAVLGPLRDLFRVKGLQVSNFVVTATFPPAQEFIPSMLGISGAIQIASLNNVSGS